MKDLTRAEEEVMQILWKLGKGFVRDILQEYPEPKPAYNTVSTIVRILQRKGFVKHTAYGKSHEYFPAISKKAYTRSHMKRMLNAYFENSAKQLVSFFSKEESVSVEELEQMKALLEEEIQAKKNQKK